ncbi:hypothetical protein LINGRAPRIM_LOCUS449 [Linum grandiflorum]
MNTKFIKPCSFLLVLAILLVIFSTSARPVPEPIPNDENGPGIGPWFFPPGTGIPDLGGGYGSGFGGPKGGHSKSGVYRPITVCKDKGPCFNKKLRCPAKCFTSYSGSGKGYGGGGGGGGCTMDCKKKCVAYC